MADRKISFLHRNGENVSPLFPLLTFLMKINADQTVFMVLLDSETVRVLTDDFLIFAREDNPVLVGDSGFAVLGGDFEVFVIILNLSACRAEKKEQQEGAEQFHSIGG